MAVLTTSVVFLGPTLAHPGNLVEADAYKRAAAKTIVMHAIAGDALEARASAAVTQPTEGMSPCVSGLSAGTYPCDDIDMLSRLSLADLGLTFGNDSWGWTDPATGKDYALMGGSEGTTIVDISRPRDPDVVGMLPTHSTAGGDFWRDIKVYQNHMFVGSENTGHGIQVFDLTQVRGVTGPPVTFSNTARYDRLSNSHNIHINEETGYLYAVGATRNTAAGDNPCLGGGLHMIDISSPASPTFAGCFAEHMYIHDTQCVVYDGPDADHRGSEICFNSAATTSAPGGVHTLSIVDVSDKANPVALAREDYPNPGYSHQGWLTPDSRWFLHGDELDEVRNGLGTTTRVWDVSDLDNPVLANTFENATTSIDHNMYTEGKKSYHSNYTSGLRVYDNMNLPALSEKAFFDVYPENDNASFEGGTWSNYVYYKQEGIITVSSIDRGLFILRHR
jgi:choice-of-anchor B domain-containing protein